jgi:hypothetical protein
MGPLPTLSGRKSLIAISVTAPLSSDCRTRSMDAKATGHWSLSGEAFEVVANFRLQESFIARF